MVKIRLIGMYKSYTILSNHNKNIPLRDEIKKMVITFSCRS